MMKEAGRTCKSVEIDCLSNGLIRRDTNGDLNDTEDIRISVPSFDKNEGKFPSEKWKTFVAFIFMFMNLVLNLTCLSIVHERLPERTKYPPLPDIFFDLFPPSDWALDVSEGIIVVSVWSTLFMIFIHRHGFIILRRVFLIMGLLYFMRSITMFVTQVPVASTTYYCSPKANKTSAGLVLGRVIHMLGGLGLSINGRHTYCGDYIYSGHTVILTMAYLVMHEYTPRRWCFIHWLMRAASVTGIFMVLLSRGHYTVDVIIAYFATTRIFWIYHTLANNSILKNEESTNFLSNVWWFSLFLYFERNVNGVLPNQYQWPLPWPRRCFRSPHVS